MKETKQKRFKHPVYTAVLLFILILGALFIFLLVTHQPSGQNRFFNQLFTENMPGLFEEQKLDRAAEFDVVIEYFEKRNGRQITTNLVKGYYTTVRVHVEVMTKKTLFAFNGKRTIYDFRFAAMYEMNKDKELKLAEGHVVFPDFDKNTGLDIKVELTGYRCPEYAGENEKVDPKTADVANQVFDYLVETGQMVTRYEMEQGQ